MVKADDSSQRGPGFNYRESLTLFSVYSLYVTIYVPMTCLTLKRLQKFNVLTQNKH